MDRNSFEIEICANSIQSVLAADEAGADRVELCDNLLEGGTTPSLALIELAKQKTTIDIFPIIRPRAGDFLYNKNEIQIMLQDIKHAIDSGADGIVIGCLKADGSINFELLKHFVEQAKGKPVTFHRAFDMCDDAFTALELIKNAGCNRILTSGQKDKAIDGVHLIKKLVEKAGNDIQIMCGSGIDEMNIRMISQMTGASAFHASLREEFVSKMDFQRSDIYMGGVKEVNEFSNRFSSTQRIKNLIRILKNE